MVHERLGEDADVGDREVQPLRAGRRDDVRRVAGQEQAAVLHRLGDEAAHAGDALLEHRPLVERPPLERGARLELLPDALVRPLAEVLVVGDLEVVARQLGPAQREQREAALVVGVDELVHRRRDLREDPEPAERVLALERAQHAGGDALAADAVEAVAAGDEVALELVGRAVVREADARPVALELVHAHALDLEQERQRQLAAAPRSGPSRPRSARRSRSSAR